VQHLFKDEIIKLAEKSGLRSTDKGWMKQYHKSVNEVIELKGGEVAKEIYGKLGEEWSNAELPDELRIK